MTRVRALKIFPGAPVLRSASPVTTDGQVSITSFILSRYELNADAQLSSECLAGRLSHSDHYVDFKVTIDDAVLLKRLLREQAERSGHWQKLILLIP